MFSPRALTPSLARRTWCCRPSMNWSINLRPMNNAQRWRNTVRPQRARATWNGPSWPRKRRACSPARTPSIRSTTSPCRFGSPTTCSSATAPARSWRCRRTMSAIWNLPRNLNCPCGWSWRPPRASRLASPATASVWRAIFSTAYRLPRRRRRSLIGLRNRAGAPARSISNCATGFSVVNVTGASRSQSFGATAITGRLLNMICRCCRPSWMIISPPPRAIRHWRGLPIG